MRLYLLLFTSIDYFVPLALYSCLLHSLPALTVVSIEFSFLPLSIVSSANYSSSRYVTGPNQSSLWVLFHHIWSLIKCLKFLRSTVLNMMLPVHFPSTLLSYNVIFGFSVIRRHLVWTPSRTIDRVKFKYMVILKFLEIALDLRIFPGPKNIYFADCSPIGISLFNVIIVDYKRP